MVETNFITASMLYDMVQCPHRVTMDLFGDPTNRDPINQFVQLLWDKGNLFEKEVIEKLQQPFLDLSPYGGDEKARLTALLEAQHAALEDPHPLVTDTKASMEFDHETAERERQPDRHQPAWVVEKYFRQ